MQGKDFSIPCEIRVVSRPKNNIRNQNRAIKLENLDIARSALVLTVILANLAAALLFYFIPRGMTHNQRVSLRYFLSGFATFALGYTSYIARQWIPLPVSVFLANLFLVFAPYSIFFGLKWRWGERVHIHKHLPVLSNVIGISLLQVLLHLYFPDSLWVRTLILYGNLAIVYSTIIIRLRKRLNEELSGERILLYSLYYGLANFALMPIVFFISSRPIYYEATALILGIIGVVVMLSAYYSLFLFDLVKLHYDNSITDSLTNLPNRRHFTNEFKRTINAARRHNFSICIILCDIDTFKSVNDKYGHSTGDKVIREFSKMLHESVRGDDIVARYGGEEFIIMLGHTNIDDATDLAERICERTRHIFVPTRDGVLSFTASFGVSQCGPELDSEACIRAADKALYAAKQTGRDKVCVTKDGRTPLPLQENPASTLRPGLFQGVQK